MAMPVVSFKAIRAERFERAMQRLGARMYPAVTAELSAWGKELVTAMQIYPPPVPYTRYKRTGKLGRGWHTWGPVVTGGNVNMKVQNKVAYVPGVQGAMRFQNPFFAGRGWRRITELNPPIWEKYRSRIRRILGELK